MAKQANIVPDKVATIVVHPTAGVGDATTIADAIAMLPASGGLIYVREGTYSISATITMPDKPVVIRGSGESTIISLGANVIGAFTFPAITTQRVYTLEDFNVVGTSVAGQAFVTYSEANSRAVVTVRGVNTDEIQFPFNVTTGTSAEPVTLNIDNCHFVPLLDGSGILVNAANHSMTIYAYMQRVRFYDEFEDSVVGTLCPNILSALGINFFGSDNYFAVGTDCTVGALNLTDTTIINFGPGANPTIRLEDDNEFALPSALTACMGAFVNFEFNGNGCIVQGGMYDSCAFVDNTESRIMNAWFDGDPGTTSVIKGTGGATIVSGNFFNDSATDYVLEGLIPVITGNYFFTSAPSAVIKENEGESIIANNYFIGSGLNIDASLTSGCVLLGNQYGLPIVDNDLGVNGNTPMAEGYHGAPSKGSLFTSFTGVTIANSAVETSLIGAGAGILTLPSYYFHPGRTIRVKATGIVSTTGTPNFTVNAKVQGTTRATVTKAFAGTIADNTFEIEILLTCYTTGAGGTAWIQGSFKCDGTTFNYAGLATTAAFTLNTTTTNAIDLSFQWGTANPANTITCTNVTVEAL